MKRSKKKIFLRLPHLFGDHVRIPSKYAKNQLSQITYVSSLHMRKFAGTNIPIRDNYYWKGSSWRLECVFRYVRYVSFSLIISIETCKEV